MTAFDDTELDRFREDFARRLRLAIGDRTLRSVAREAGISHPTLHRLLRAQVMPDVQTIIRLERVLDVQLWPLREFLAHDE